MLIAVSVCSSLLSGVHVLGRWKRHWPSHRADRGAVAGAQVGGAAVPSHRINVLSLNPA